MKRISLVILTTLFIIGSTAIASIAGVKTIYPDQLVPHGNHIYYKDSLGASGGTVDGYAYFSAKVRIPVGKTITKVKYYHSGSSGAGNTWIKLERGQMGGYIEEMAYLYPLSYIGNFEIEETIIDFAKIKKGYIYQVRVFSRNLYSKIQGIKIYYK